jgi:AcrR family transcriptional regulator
VSKKPTDTQRRGRPRNAELPGVILAAAFAEFSDKGFLATRLDDIAARGGIAKGTLYLYFGSKEELFEAAVRARIVPVIGQVQTLTSAHDGPTVDLLQLVVRVMHARIATPDVQTLLRILISDGQRFPGLIEFYYREVVSKMFAMLENIVQRGVKRGEYPAGAVTRLPAALVAPALMSAFWQMTFAKEHELPPDQFLDAHLDLIARALKP